MAITIAFYGEKASDYTLVADALCDWLGYGQPDEEGYYAPPDETEQIDILVSGRPGHADAVSEIVAWTARADLPYTTVAKRALGRGERLEPGEGEEIQVVRDIESYISSVLNVAADQDCAALVLMVGDEGPDEAGERLLGLLHEGVDVLVLADALLPLDAAAQGVQQVPATPDEVSDTAARQAADALRELAVSVEQTAWPIGDLLEMLDEQARWFYEASNAIGGLLLELSEHAQRQREQIKQARTSGLLASAPEQIGTEQSAQIEQQPAAPQEPAVLLPTPTKVRREWLDPADGTWKPVGRGRPRKDVEIREVPAA